MQPSRITPGASPARRFLLLPEDPLQAGAARRPRIRRYQLTAVSARSARPAGRAADARVRGDDAPGRI
jgi:hypothetical protein